MCKLCIASITRRMMDNGIQVISVLRMDKAVFQIFEKHKVILQILC